MQASSFLSHFTVMMGPFGLYQHATIREPLLSEGYCTDDNARAVMVLGRLLSLVSPKDTSVVRGLLLRCWEFVCEAELESGRYHNFRTSEGAWLETDESEDMYARLIRMLVEVLRNDQVSDLHSQAKSMLRPLLARASSMQAPRFWAECVIALADLSDDTGLGGRKESLLQQGREVLVRVWEMNSSPDWMWFEERMTYANALLPHGLMAAGIYTGDSVSEDILHKSAEFLIQTTIRDGIFIPIGSNGWYPKGKTPSRDNQQAIEAGTMFDFLLAYHDAFPDRLNIDIVAAPYLWFFGHNAGGVVMADESTGACLDGLFLHGVNPNYGAESMLAYQYAELLLQHAPAPIRRYIAEAK